MARKAVIEFKQEVPIPGPQGPVGVKLVPIRLVFPLHATLEDVFKLCQLKTADQCAVSFETQAQERHLDPDLAHLHTVDGGKGIS